MQRQILYNFIKRSQTTAMRVYWTVGRRAHVPYSPIYTFSPLVPSLPFSFLFFFFNTHAACIRTYRLFAAVGICAMYVIIYAYTYARAVCSKSLEKLCTFLRFVSKQFYLLVYTKMKRTSVRVWRLYLVFSVRRVFKRVRVTLAYFN